MFFFLVTHTHHIIYKINAELNGFNFSSTIDIKMAQRLKYASLFLFA